MTGPLAGVRVLVTRPRAQGRALCERLRRLGAVATSVPTIRIVPPAPGGPLDHALARLREYDWVIVTSANGAGACLRRAHALGIDLAAAGVRWAAIGPATAGALRRSGIEVDMIPSRYLTEAIVDEFAVAPGDRLLLPRTDVAPPGLAEALRARGAVVDQVPAYRTDLAPARSRSRIRRLIDARMVDVVVVTSASTVHGLVRLLHGMIDALRQVEIACIGPVTAAAVVEEGLVPSVVADPHTVDGLIAALVTRYAIRITRGVHHAGDRRTE